MRRTAPCQPSTAGRAHVANSLFNLLANAKPVDVWLQWGPAPTTAYGWLAGKRGMAGQPACRIYLSEAGGRGRRRCDGEGPLRSRRCQNGTTRNTLSPKFFPKKFGQKIGAGPPTGNFGNGLCAGPGSAPPRPPFVQMKNTPGGPSRGADFQARHSARAIDHWVGRSAVGHQFHAHVTENISAPSH